MSLELGLWRVDGTPVRLANTVMPLEKTLEGLIERDPTILGEPLLIIGRQVPTAHGKIVDLLAVDGDGVLHAIELKRDKTPRDATAQALDYGSWVQGLTHDDVLELFNQYRTGDSFEQVFTDRFGVTPPEEINTSHVLTIVASDMDPATERIITYLASYQVPINVAMFRYFLDGDRAYLARTWLLPETQTPDTTGHPAGPPRNPGTGRTGTSPSARRQAAGPGRTHADTASSPPAAASGTPARCEPYPSAPAYSSTSPAPATWRQAPSPAKPARSTSPSSPSAPTNAR